MYIDALLHGLDPLPSDPKVKAELEERAVAEGLAALKTELYHLDPEHSSGHQRILKRMNQTIHFTRCD